MRIYDKQNTSTPHRTVRCLLRMHVRAGGAGGHRVGVGTISVAHFGDTTGACAIVRECSRACAPHRVRLIAYSGGVHAFGGGRGTL